ncbi:uncharacterized protein LOC115570881 isoform X2 [Sparus aurata]|uniref:uncharacterized protein LOC115570881 isoform X2 n=1 Tax=Sparus aurata TaxID=8175 RepID=UPI0011C1CED2|nr:uncharacterized protein LOC115570881 isoform X2 [Sparus aurata]
MRVMDEGSDCSSPGSFPRITGTVALGKQQVVALKKRPEPAAGAPAELEAAGQSPAAGVDTAAPDVEPPDGEGATAPPGVEVPEPGATRSPAAVCRELAAAPPGTERRTGLSARASKRLERLRRGGEAVASWTLFLSRITTSDQDDWRLGVEEVTGRGQVEVSHGAVSWRAALSWIMCMDCSWAMSRQEVSRACLFCSSCESRRMSSLRPPVLSLDPVCLPAQPTSSPGA